MQGDANCPPENTLPKRAYSKPTLRQITLTESELDQIRSAKDPIAAFEAVYMARKSAGTE